MKISPFRSDICAHIMKIKSCSLLLYITPRNRVIIMRTNKLVAVKLLDSINYEKDLNSFSCCFQV